MKSNLYSLNYADFAKGIALAIMAAVLSWFLQAIDAPGFSVSTIDWNEISRIAVSAGVAYLLKNYLSTSDGKIMGSIG